MTRATRAAVALAALTALAQLIPVTRDNPAVVQDVAAPDEIRMLLRRACYDCHSRETVWPWYSRVAPVSWLVAHDVNEGREELDFSAWRTIPPEKHAKKLKEAAEEVRDGEMPPWYYVLLHPGAQVTAAERDRLIEWFTAERGQPPR